MYEEKALGGANYLLAEILAVQLVALDVLQ
jgi:hypothetical protein